MSWEFFQNQYTTFPQAGFALDTSRIQYSDRDLQSLLPSLEKAFQDMKALESGTIANPDEGRMVGHYWLRDPDTAPKREIVQAIEETLEAIERFVRKIHQGEIQGRDGNFSHFLVIGIGGSALGPQFVAEALGQADTDKMKPAFFDNTDPEGFDAVLKELEPVLGRTLVVVISKSGGTPETRNGMLEAKSFFEGAGISFGSQALAITGKGSRLDTIAESEGWLARFPMWDWVGGRTSETGPVGLIPASLQGISISKLLEGARQMDALTRIPDYAQNPAAQLAAMWYFATEGAGKKDMVILPYKDRLQLFSRYLQQLVMESLGKERNLDGKVVNQGISVYGNKGSTDQHAYVQQLREGVLNFFVIFIEVLNDRQGPSIEVEPGITSGDYLNGLYLGTREALYENNRQSLTITVDTVNAATVGGLIALFERAVGLYASLVNVNAYHQPGVEAGKKAAAAVLDLQKDAVAFLSENTGKAFTASEIAAGIQRESQTEWIFKTLSRLTFNGRVNVDAPEAPYPTGSRFSVPD